MTEKPHLQDSLPKIIRCIPRECLRPSTLRSVIYLVHDVILTSLLILLILKVDTIWLAAPLSFLLGTVMTGLFVIAHDAGHRSFSPSLKVNNFVGQVLSSVLVWPFHVWRLSHDTHHRYTHHIAKEIAWRPFTQEKLERFGIVNRFLYLFTRSWGFVIGSMFFTFYFVKDALRGFKSRHFSPGDLRSIRFSIFLTFIAVSLMTAASFYVASWYGFVFLVLVPHFTFQFWMSTFTFLHHTHPESLFMNDDQWTPAKAQLHSTIHVKYPRWVEWLTHDISWHVPHHVCVGIPHYHLRKAHEALLRDYPEAVREEVFSLSYVKRVINSCQIAGEVEQGYVRWSRFEKLPQVKPVLEV